MENTVKSTISEEKLLKENEYLKQKNLELEEKIKLLEDLFRLNQHKLFGRSSEKTPIPEQISLFNEAEAESNPKIPEPTVEEVTYKRKKRQGHRDEMLKDLPVETIEYKLPEEEQVCNCCSGKLHEMSTETRREIEVIPAQIKVVEHVRYVYCCRDCEKNEITTPIVTAPMPAPAISGSIASSSAIAYVMTQKYMFGLPLHRQEQQWKQLDIEISRQTMANWIIKAATRWLVIIYMYMHEDLLKRDIIHADESGLQVLKEPGRAATSESYMWLYRTGRDGPPIVLFEYQTTRASKHPKKFMEGFKGYLCTDGYSGYVDMPEITNVACWSHARRKFSEALKALPKDIKGKSCAAQEGLDFCNRLFKIEEEFHDVNPKKRYEGRLEKSKPLLDEFYKWLKKQQREITPKSLTGQAVKYCLNLWDRLTAILLDGRLFIDNNISERTIKNFVIGRKNYLFCNTPNGATSSAIVYSIIETAKENGLKPFEYLKYLFDRLPNSDVKDHKVLDSLMPWSKDIPDFCRIS
jgi:transposase